MSRARLGLVADPSQLEVVRTLSSSFEDIGIFNPTRSRFAPRSFPVFADLEVLLREVDPTLCCFLSPYTRMGQDLMTCIDRRVHVLSAGPFSLTRQAFEETCQAARESRVYVETRGRHRCSRVNNALLDESARPGFGRPVYLRLVTGGGVGLLSAWWAACEGLAQAEGLLRAAIADLRVTAIKTGRRHHVTLTSQMDNRALAQLVVAPVRMLLGGDLTLLGTGGLLSGDSIQNATPVIKEGGTELHSHAAFCPDPDWVRDFAQRIERSEPALPDWETLSFQRRVLRAIRQAVREGRPVRVEV
jgi:predicted dehydrogenase